MKPVHALAYAGLLLAATGCSTVTINEPIGDLASLAERNTLEGQWVNDDGEVMEVRARKSGEMVCGGLEWDDESKSFRAHSVPFRITTLRGLKLINVRDEEDSNKGYSFIRYVLKDENTVQLYLPEVSVFESAVSGGELAGTVDRNDSVYVTTVDVHVDASADVVDAFLKKSGDAACFEQEPSVTFKRLNRLK